MTASTPSCNQFMTTVDVQNELFYQFHVYQLSIYYFYNFL